MVNILIVSHSFYLAKSIYELMREMKTSDFEMLYTGGLNSGTEFGTNPQKIHDKIETLLKTRDVLLVCDLGSTVLNSHKAIEMLPAEQRGMVKVADCPFFEGLLTAVVQNQGKITLDQLAEMAHTTKIKK